MSVTTDGGKLVLPIAQNQTPNKQTNVTRLQLLLNLLLNRNGHSKNKNINPNENAKDVMKDGRGEYRGTQNDWTHNARYPPLDYDWGL